MMTSPSDIQISLYDTDELSEELRLQMCESGMQIILDMDVRFVKNRKTGTSKYYVVDTGMCTQVNNAIKQPILIQAFDCPTAPKIYIHINNCLKRGHTFWTIINESEFTLRPAFDIMGYTIVLVKSIEVYNGKYRIV